MILLLGLQAADGLHAVLSDGTVLLDLGPALAVPGKQGWTRVELERVEVGAESLALLRVAPAGALPVPTLHSASGCEEHRSIELDFVSEALTSWAVHGGGYCGGAHPWAASHHHNRAAAGGRSALDRGEETEAELALDELLGSGAATRLAAAAEASLAGKPDDEVDCFREGPRSWALVHRRGRWALEGYVGYAYEACRGMEWPFEPGLEPPRRLREDPGTASAEALDWAQGAGWRVETRKEAVALVAGETTLATLPLGGARIVQVDRAYGAAAARWRHEAAEAARRPALIGRVEVVVALPGGGLSTWEAGRNGLRWLDDEGEEPDAFPGDPADAPPGQEEARPPPMRVTAIDADGVDVEVEGAIAHVGWAPTLLRAEEVVGTGPAPEAPATMAFDGFELRCTDALELWSEGRKLAAVPLGAPAPACRILGRVD